MEHPRIEYEKIETTPARQLLELSNEEIEKLIVTAREHRDRAARIIQWLTAIRFEKRIREEVDTMDRGEYR